jgi:dipeptidase D
VHERLFGREPAVTAVDAGLEPSVIAGRPAGLDMLALGPPCELPQSPDERLEIGSIERSWPRTAAPLGELSSPAGAPPAR